MLNDRCRSGLILLIQPLLVRFCHFAFHALCALSLVFSSRQQDVPNMVRSDDQNPRIGPGPFQLNGRGEANDAVHKAAAQGQPVEQQIALSVRGDRVQCAINGTVVGDYPKSDVVGPGKLKTTDGVYGIRSAHNTEVLVTGLKVTRP